MFGFGDPRLLSETQAPLRRFTGEPDAGNRHEADPLPSNSETPGILIIILILNLNPPTDLSQVTLNKEPEIKVRMVTFCSVSSASCERLRIKIMIKSKRPGKIGGSKKLCVSAALRETFPEASLLL